MRILIFGGTPTHRGGVELFCERAREALAAAGHHADHVHTNASYLRPRSLHKFLASIGRIVLRRGQFKNLWLQYVSLPDLVLLAAAKCLGYQILVTPHLGSNWSSQTNKILRHVSSTLLWFSDAIGLISSSQAQEIMLPGSVPRYELVTFLPRRFPPRHATPAPSERLRLVHAGRLSEGKGTFLFLEVCAALQSSGFNFEAQLIGSCDDSVESSIQSIVASNHLADRITRVGLVSQSEMLEHLTASDVLIHLSRVDSFPLIVLESLGCGVYPICKDLPGARLIVEKYEGLIVDSVTAVDTVVCFLLATPVWELRDAAAIASRRVHDDFHWDSCVSAIERTFEDLEQNRFSSRIGVEAWIAPRKKPE